MRSVPVSLGLNGSETSYWRSSPVPQQLTYNMLSSSDRLMSETSGGTALNPWSIGGSTDGSAGSAGISITLRVFHVSLASSWYHIQTELDRSARLITTPTKPYAFLGSCAGRSSSTICCSAPSSSFCTCLRLRRSQTCSEFPYFPPSSSSGFKPELTMFGVPHSLVIIVSCPRCHQKSYARYCGPRSISHAPFTSNVS